MLKRMPYRDAPAELRKLIEELQEHGDYLVVEDEQRQAVACLSPLSDSGKAHKDEAARQLRQLLDKVPASPYSEEATYRLIDEAISEVRRERREKAIG